MSQHPFEDRPFILVSGQARSGTTVLTKAIAAHPEVHSNGKESSYVADVARLLKTNIEKPHVVSELVESSEHFVAQFRSALFETLFPQSQLDNTSSNTPTAVSTFSSIQVDIADGLKVLFPQLVVANIVRNGIEVVASRMSHATIGKFSFENHCTAWAHSIDMARWGEDNDCLLLIRHEHLMNPASTSRAFNSLQKMVGLNHSNNCANYVSENQINSKFDSIDSRERKAELQKRAERWRHWTSTQREMFETICEPTMNYFGYAIPWKAGQVINPQVDAA